MILAWHIVKKDLFRLRWILALWVAVLVAGLTLTEIQAALDFENFLPFHIAATVVISGFLPLIVLGLVMGLLLDDPVIEIDAFWITRPISGGRLLVAKTLGLLVLVVIPIGVLIPFWLSYDYRWDQVVLAVQQTLRSHCIVIALALPFAVMSANGSKFVMNLIIWASGLLLLSLLLQLGTSGSDTVTDPGLIESKAWLLTGLWLATTLLVTLIQFLRCRSRHSFAVLLFAVVAGFVVAKWYPRPLDFVARRSVKSSIAAGARFGWPILPAMIDGKADSSVVVAEVPLRVGAGSIQEGTRLTIHTVFLDFTGLLQVSFGEATPRLSEEFRDLLPGTVPPARLPEHYFIINRSDGRGFAVEPTRSANELDAATLHFSHSSISMRPAGAWQGTAPGNLAAWLNDATLVKVVADVSERNETVPKTVKSSP